MPESSVLEHQIDDQQVFKSETDIPRDQDSVVLNTGHTADLENFFGQNFDPSWKVKVEGRNVPFSKIPLEHLVAESRADVLAATEILRVLHMELSQTDVLQKTKQANTLLDKEMMLNEVPKILDAADYDLAKIENLMPIIDSFLAEIKDKQEEYKSDPNFMEILKLTLDGKEELSRKIIDLRDAIAETRGRIDPEFALTFRLYYAGPLGKKGQEYPEDSWVHKDVLNVDLENFARIEADEMVDRKNGKTIPWSYDRKMIFILENLTIGEGHCQIIETETHLEIPDPEDIGLTGRDLTDFNQAIPFLQELSNCPYIILDGFGDDHGSPIDITGRRGWRIAMGNLFGTDEFKDFYSQNKLKWNSFLFFLNGLNILTLLLESPALEGTTLADSIITLFGEASVISERDYSLLPTLPPEGTKPTPENSKVGFMEYFDQKCRDLMRQFSELAQKNKNP